MFGRIKAVWKNQRGVTLVELLVVLALLGVVLAGVYNFFFFAQAGWDRSSAEARVAQEARLTLMKMESEIRQARKATETPAPPAAVEVWQGGVRVEAPNGGTQLDIYTDVDGDARPELVRYRLQGQVLERGVAAPIGTSSPYTYGAPTGWETMARLVTNADLFQVGPVGSGPPDDHRRQVTIRLVLDDPENPLVSPLEVGTAETGPTEPRLLVVTSRSRNSAE